MVTITITALPDWQTRILGYKRSKRCKRGAVKVFNSEYEHEQEQTITITGLPDWRTGILTNCRPFCKRLCKLCKFFTFVLGQLTTILCRHFCRQSERNRFCKPFCKHAAEAAWGRDR